MRQPTTWILRRRNALVYVFILNHASGDFIGQNTSYGFFSTDLIHWSKFLERECELKIVKTYKMVALAESSTSLILNTISEFTISVSGKGCPFVLNIKELPWKI